MIYFQVFWRAYFLGCSFLLGLFIAFYQAEVWMALGVYICVVSFFHISEYLSTAFLNPSTLKIESFLINHSTAYNIAHVLCIVEYFLWSWLIPGLFAYKAIVSYRNNRLYSYYLVFFYRSFPLSSISYRYQDLVVDSGCGSGNMRHWRNRA